MSLAIPFISSRQELYLRLIRHNPGERGHPLIREVNTRLQAKDIKHTSSGWSALKGLTHRGFVRIERPSPSVTRYFITAEGRALLDKIDEQRTRLCQPLPQSHIMSPQGSRLTKTDRIGDLSTLLETYR